MARGTSAEINSVIKKNISVPSDSQSQAKRRVALLTNMPSPYRLPFFQSLSTHCSLLVLFDSRSEPNRKWRISEENYGFPHDFLQGFFLRYRRTRMNKYGDERYLQLRFGILKRLFKFKPDVVVSAELGVRTLQADLYCRIFKCPLIIWWEGTPHTEGWQKGLRRKLREYLVKRADRFWTNGSESAALIQQYGAPAGKIDQGLTGIDTHTLADRVMRAMPLREGIRSQFALKGTTFLFIGQLIRLKGLQEYLNVLDSLYKNGIKNWSAIFIGSGPLEALLNQWIADHPQVTVLSMGFLQPDELPRYFAVADVFIMPSLDDNWALVNLEAAVSGLPQLSSIFNGGTADLIRDERIGKPIDPLNRTEFLSALNEWITKTPPRIAPELIAQLCNDYGCVELALRSKQSIERALSDQFQHS
jgi:glycosyltransferase involved in cell wall biosynthesis